MKKLLALAAATLVALPAVAGGGLTDYACRNACPLAKQANAHRAYGTEAAATSTVVRAELTRRVTANLERI